MLEETTLPAGTASLLERLTVADAMHRGVFRCSRTTSLSAVARIMAAHRVHCVIVTDDERIDRATVWGMVSDRDVAAALLTRPLEVQTAEGSATTPAVSITESEPLLRAAHRMTEHGVTHLVVLGGDTKAPVGVISTLDIADAIS
jgi:CBS domain-containing protein